MQYALLAIGVIVIILLCVLFYHVRKFVRKEANRGNEENSAPNKGDRPKDDQEGE